MQKKLLKARIPIILGLVLLALSLDPLVLPRSEASNTPVLRTGRSTVVQGGPLLSATVANAFPILPFEITLFLGEWGTKGAGPGQFNQPLGVAVDSWNNVYVVDSGNKRIQKFTAMGEFITQWGQPGSGTIELSSPWGIAVDPAGCVYVTDNDKDGNGRVLKFTGDGTYIAQWRRPDLGGDISHAWGGIAADAFGFIYVVENYYALVWKFTNEGQTVWRSSAPFLYRPLGVAVDPAGFVYVSDPINRVVSKFTSDGVFVENWLKDENGLDLFHTPIGLAVDPGLGLYVVDNKEGYQDVIKLTLNGKPLGSITPIGMMMPQYVSPMLIALSPLGLIYVTDYGKSCVNILARFELGRQP
jgi:DNA-binding beta-propeller fold protein YncE